MKKIFLITITGIINILAASNLWACDVYTTKSILQSGSSASVNNTCSVYDITSLASIGGSKLFVYVAGFDTYDAKRIANTGASVIAKSSDFDNYDMRQVIDAMKVKSNFQLYLRGYDSYDSRTMVAKGISFILDNSFDTYDIKNICSSKTGQGIGYVDATGIDNYDLNSIKNAGCILFNTGSLPNVITSFSAAKTILQSGGSLSVGHEFSVSEITQLAAINKDKITVAIKDFYSYQVEDLARLGVKLTANAKDFYLYQMESFAKIAKEKLFVRMNGYYSYEAESIVSNGASFILDSSFARYQIKSICSKIISPAIGYVLAGSFAQYELSDIASSGCRIVANESDLTSQINNPVFGNTTEITGIKSGSIYSQSLKASVLIDSKYTSQKIPIYIVAEVVEYGLSQGLFMLSQNSGWTKWNGNWNDLISYKDITVGTSAVEIPIFENLDLQNLTGSKVWVGFKKSDGQIEYVKIF